MNNQLRIGFVETAAEVEEEDDYDEED